MAEADDSVPATSESANTPFWFNSESGLSTTFPQNHVPFANTSLGFKSESANTPFWFNSESGLPTTFPQNHVPFANTSFGFTSESANTPFWFNSESGLPATFPQNHVPFANTSLGFTSESANTPFWFNSESGLPATFPQNHVPFANTSFGFKSRLLPPISQNPESVPTRNCPSPDTSTQLPLGLNPNPEREGSIPTWDNPSHDPVTESNCSQQHPGPVPKIGMAFQSEEAAYEFYKKYAENNGFKVRKGKVQRSASGEVIKRSFLCSREGTRMDKQTQKATKCRRKETRTGCKAMIIVKVTDKGWEIIGLNLDHHHEHVSPSQNPQEKRSCRNISDAHPIIGTVNEAGMAKEAADAQNVGLRGMDCNNDLRDKKMNILNPEDVQSFIDYLRSFQTKDQSFFYTVRVDAEGCVANFFWRDGKSKTDHDYFRDVLILDTTFRMDIYDMICAPFVGVNHHRHYVLLGCAFLLDETTESFIWLFESFLEATGRRQPKTIFTDERPAMANAIGKVLPETQHRLCMWHICQNAIKDLPGNYSQPNLESLIVKRIFDCQSEEQFQSMWDCLLDRYNLRDYPRLQDMYKFWEKWSHIFCSKKTFSASRSGEDVNDVFHNLPSETMSLTKFAQQYEKEAERRRKEELDEDFRNNKPLIIESSSQIEKQAAGIYTWAVFKLFQKQLQVNRALEIKEIISNRSMAVYHLKEGHWENIVGYNCLDETVSCTCTKFESIGILCVHALKVLNARNIFEIPDKYIMQRWTKYAKYAK